MLMRDIILINLMSTIMYHDKNLKNKRNFLKYEKVHSKTIALSNHHRNKLFLTKRYGLLYFLKLKLIYSSKLIT